MTHVTHLTHLCHLLLFTVASPLSKPSTKTFRPKPCRTYHAVSQSLLLWLLLNPRILITVHSSVTSSSPLSRRPSTTLTTLSSFAADAHLVVPRCGSVGQGKSCISITSQHVIFPHHPQDCMRPCRCCNFYQHLLQCEFYRRPKPRICVI